jgi:hypothetical protein
VPEKPGTALFPWWIFEMELWRVVPSLPIVLASSFGRLMVVPTISPMPHGGERHYESRPRSGEWDGDRYIFCHRGKTYKVARLICEAFNGPPSPGLNTCMHGDENARNNRPENLKWGTQKINLNAPGFIEHCRGRTGENSPVIKGRAA